MSDVYLDICIAVPPEPSVRELLAFQLHALGFSGFLEEEATLHCFRPEEGWNDAARSDLERLLAQHLPPFILTEIRRVENENWNKLWEESIVPVEVGDNFVVAPSWRPVPSAEKKIVITIDPKMSFGTGYHESTRLMLRMMERHGRSRSPVLDFGTGTGVLAIAAAKLGSQRVIGIDNDEWSYLNAVENVGKNRCGGAVEIRFGSYEAVPESGFEMILANLTKNTLLEMIPTFSAKLATKGVLLCSGLLNDDRAAVEDALRISGCTPHSGCTENEWTGVAATKG